MREVEIATQNNGKISGTLFSASETGKQPAVIISHGLGGNQSSRMNLAAVLCEHGFTCLTFDLRGHGKSSGSLKKLSLADFLDDHVAAYDFLLGQSDVDVEKIGLVSSSMGAYLSILLSAKRKVAWMVLRAPANYPDWYLNVPIEKALNQKVVTEWRKQKKSWDSTEALRTFHTFTGSVLIVEMECDEEVPRRTLLNYVEAASSSQGVDHYVIPGATHSLSRNSAHRAIFESMVLSWVEVL